MNFFKIYGIAISILILVSLLTNNIFKDKNLVFKNEIKTKFNTLNNKKVIFLVFDTLDYEFLFQEVHNLELPNLKKLKSKSIFFSNAFPPASKTLNVIPSLLIGKYPQSFIIDGNFKETSMIDLNNAEIKFNYENSIFSDLKVNSNFNDENFSIVGRYHPICNIFENIHCENFTAKFSNETKVYWYSGVVRLCETVGEVIKYIKNNDSCNVLKNKTIKRHQAIDKEINYIDENWESFFNKNVNFTFLHILAPKPEDYPYGEKFLSNKNSFYKKKQNIVASHKKYAQNVIYVDELIGRLLDTIQDYNDYMLIITGDTSLMEQNKIQSNRVPLIVNIKNNSKDKVIKKNLIPMILKK